jgi:hypothetical protein
MARSAAVFRQSDVTKALKAAVAGGIKVARIEIDRAGKIVLVTGENKDAVQSENEWDAIK